MRSRTSEGRERSVTEVVGVATVRVIMEASLGVLLHIIIKRYL
jgi:hypothetical protein